MIQIFIDNFMALAPIQLPFLINRERMEQPIIYEDYALLTFNLEKPYTLSEIMEMLEEQMELIPLYHKISSDFTSFGQSCCSYSNPDFGHMYKINAMTDGKGLVNSISVTIYVSLEFMCADLCNELELHSKGGYFRYRREKAEILANFI